MRTVISIAGFDPSGGAGTLADIKTFAAKMLEQHRAMNGDLKTLALQKQVTLPEQPAEPDRGTLDQLRGRKGPDFDVVYVQKAAVDAHVMANRLYETAARQSADPQVRDFAQRALPMLARDAMRQTRLLVNNPRPLSEADALAIYTAAY